MTTKRLFGWRKLFLIATVLPCCRSLEVSIPQKEYEVARGDDIILTCSFVPARPVTNTLVLTWEGYPDTAGEPMLLVATYFINNPINIAPGYEGRAFVEVDTDRQVSTLRLTKVTMQDSRSYQCSVMIFNDDEGTPAATTSLLVLVPPSKPICSLKGEAEYWNDITLTCMSEEGSPKPVYEWKSYSVENIPRPFPMKTTERDGALSLFNISRETSGFFNCTSANRIGSNTCSFTLAVMPTSMNVGSTGAIVGGVLAGLVLLGIVIFCCYKKKCKKDKYAEGVPGDVEFYDKDASEAGEQFWDDKSTGEKKQVNQREDEDVVPQNNFTSRAAHTPEDDQHSYNSGKEKNDDGRGSDVDSRRYQDDQRDHRRGSRDNLDDERGRYGGSRDRLDDERKRDSGSRDRVDQRDHYSGSRDRLDDPHDSHRGSRDRLDDQHDSHRASRDRLDDQHDSYRGSRDRLDDQHDSYRGSRDRLDDQHDSYRGSRDRLDDQRDAYRGSRDRLDDQRDAKRGSRDRLDDRRDRSGGSRDRLDYTDDQNRNRY